MAEIRRAFVLAAGLGTRLRPLTDELPKPVWPLFDVPLAAHVARALAGAGVTELVVNLHHLGDRLREALEPWLPRGLSVSWSPEAEILGTGGALAPWRGLLADEPFFLCNADTYQDVDLGDLAAFHAGRRALATLVVRRVPEGRRAPIEIGTGGRIVRFLGERAPGSGPGEPCDFTGIHLLDPAVLRGLPEGRFCINADVHARLVAGGAPLFGYVPPGEPFWSDLGTPERYLAAHRHFLAAGTLPPACPGRLVLSDEATPEGGSVRAPCYFGAEASVGRGAVAGPFAVLGAGARLEAGASAEESVVWAGGRVAGRAARNEVISPSGLGVAAPEPSEREAP